MNKNFKDKLSFNLMKKLILNKYNKVIKYSVFANNINPYLNNGNLKDDSFHNYFRLKTLPKGETTYCGEFKCGVTCFILGNLLKQDGLDVKMYLYQEGYGKYKEDHVFLKYNNLIIDPTYRQFFTNNINVTKRILAMGENPIARGSQTTKK